MKLIFNELIFCFDSNFVYFFEFKKKNVLHGVLISFGFPQIVLVLSVNKQVAPVNIAHPGIVIILILGAHITLYRTNYCKYAFFNFIIKK